MPFKAKPEKLPQPTYWPFFLAFGVALVFWGILTNWVVSLIGAILFILSIRGWIIELFFENKKEDDDA